MVSKVIRIKYLSILFQIFSTPLALVRERASVTTESLCSMCGLEYSTDAINRFTQLSSFPALHELEKSSSVLNLCENESSEPSSGNSEKGSKVVDHDVYIRGSEKKTSLCSSKNNFTRNPEQITST